MCPGNNLHKDSLRAEAEKGSLIQRETHCEAISKYQHVKHHQGSRLHQSDPGRWMMDKTRCNPGSQSRWHANNIHWSIHYVLHSTELQMNAITCIWVKIWLPLHATVQRGDISYHWTKGCIPFLAIACSTQAPHNTIPLPAGWKPLENSLVPEKGEILLSYVKTFKNPSFSSHIFFLLVLKQMQRLWQWYNNREDTIVFLYFPRY